MNYTNASISELIKLRDHMHIEGLPLFDLLEALVESRKMQETLEDELIEAKRDLESLEEKTIDFDNYASFFDECFERLNEHYPCPEVTSDYDQSVIFDAISKGDNPNFETD